MSPLITFNEFLLNKSILIKSFSINFCIVCKFCGENLQCFLPCYLVLVYNKAVTTQMCVMCMQFTNKRILLRKTPTSLFLGAFIVHYEQKPQHVVLIWWQISSLLSQTRSEAFKQCWEEELGTDISNPALTIFMIIVW